MQQLAKTIPKFYRRLCYSFFASLLISHACLANIPFTKPHHTVMSLGLGAAISNNVSTSKIFPIVNPNTDEFFIYTANNSYQTVGAVDAFIGGEWALRPNWAMQLGLGYNQAWNLSANGNLIQGADTASQNAYTYHYSIAARQVLLEGKLLYQYKEKYYPYLLLGLGTSFNSATDYGTNVPPFLTFTREYANNTKSSFSYLLGFGVETDILEHLRAGIGYRFADFGRASLGNATIDTTSVGGTLTQNHIYVSEILAQLTMTI